MTHETEPEPTTPAGTANALALGMRGLGFVMLAIVFTIVFIILFAFVDEGKPDQISIPLAFGLGVVAAAWVALVEPARNAARRRRETEQKLAQLADEIRNYVISLEKRRAFAPVAVPGLHLEPGEFAIRHDRATLAEIRRVRVGGGLGTRVRVGKIPIYLGAWQSAPMNDLREVGAGDLVLTNRRLLFIGAHTLSIPFDQLLKCQQHDAGLVVSDSRHKSPHVFVLETAGLWYFLVNWATDKRFENPRLPDNVHLRIVGEPPAMQVQVGTVDELR